MGTSLIRISVIANRSHASDYCNISDIEEFPKTNEVLLLETSSKVELKQASRFSSNQNIQNKSANIGKIAKVSERRIRDEHHPVFPMVS